MYFLRGLIHHEYLLEKDCPRTIWLPPAIQDETSPSQNWWRSGDLSLNVACPSCKRVSNYLEPNCLWGPVESKGQLEEYRNTAIYLLAVPCDAEPSAHLINMLVIANRDEPPSANSESVTSLWARDVVCEKGHTTTFRLTGKSSRIVNEYVKFWPEKE